MPIWTSLPPNLPVPIDDGAADHLRGARLPAVALPTTSGRFVDLAALPDGRTVIYAYPRTGRPDRPVPPDWEVIPGALGCTLQACAFRDHHEELSTLGARVFALSTQETTYQQEMAGRLHLPFEVMSDAGFELTDAIRLPTFDAGGLRLLRRLTLIVHNGEIEHVFYPVFPPNESAAQVVAWLRSHPLPDPASSGLA